jgi:hypothetical protein
VTFTSVTAQWLDSTLQPTSSAVVGEQVSFLFIAQVASTESGCLLIINESPAGFVPTTWSRTPSASLTGFAPPIIYQANTGVASIGSTTTVPTYGVSGLFYIVTGTFTTAGTKRFSVTGETTPSPPVTGAATLRVSPTAAAATATINPGLPLVCNDGPVGWEPDYTAGRLDFASYTIPNWCVRFVEGGPFELHVAQLTGDSVDVISGRIAYPKREPIRKARVACQMLFGVDTAGTPYSDLHEGATTNWSQLTRIADAGRTSTDGLQAVQYTPFVGGPVYSFNARVQPPITGTVQNGVGMAFGLVIDVPNPSAVLP